MSGINQYLLIILIFCQIRYHRSKKMFSTLSTLLDLHFLLTVLFRYCAACMKICIFFHILLLLVLFSVNELLVVIAVHYMF